MRDADVPAHRTIFAFAQVAKGGTTMKDDLEDIPMAYLWYVILAIIAIAAATVTIVIRSF